MRHDNDIQRALDYLVEHRNHVNDIIDELNHVDLDEHEYEFVYDGPRLHHIIDTPRDAVYPAER